MIEYEICYLGADSALLASYVVQCAGDKQASILAHAMRPDRTRRLEVWRGASLVYERPQTQRAVAIEALRPRPVLIAAE